ncbi:MAG: hypothetical protein V9G19_06470 [Tetrasphaera sp.]
MIVYLDTSALVPLMIEEPTSTACGELWDMHDASRRAVHHGLRGYDATHLAAAIQMRDAELVAASGDKRLLAAWRREQLNVRDVSA